MFGSDVIVRKEPVGVVAAIIPWNMPQFLIVTKLIPALLAGCTVVVKPAPEAPLDALLLAEMLEQVGLPPGVVSMLPAGREAGAHLVSNPGVDKVSFTGSTAAGRQVALACAANLTKVSLELGGKSAAIALDDSDPVAVATGVRISAMGMSGQICNALTRVLVPAGRADEFADALGAVVSALRIGDPTDPDTEIGPLVAQRQQDRVRGYIEDGIREGARVVVGGAEMPDEVDRGWYVRPTVFADVDNTMKIAREEIFGPVLTRASPYQDEDGGAAYRQRLRLRTRRLGLHERRRARARRGHARPHWNVRRQRGLRDGSGGALRRREGQRLRTRARARGPRGFPRHQVDLGRGHDLSRRKRCPMQIRSTTSAEMSST